MRRSEHLPSPKRTTEIMGPIGTPNSYAGTKHRIQWSTGPSLHFSGFHSTTMLPNGASFGAAKARREQMLSLSDDAPHYLTCLWNVLD